MLSRYARLLVGSIVSLAACTNSDMPAAEDMAVAPPDLAMRQVAKQVDIRDLNTGKVPSGTLVKFSSVFIGPLAYYEVADDKMGCNLNLSVAQADPTPTLHDGIEVVYEKVITDRGDMGLTSGRCKTLTAGEPFTKLVTGHALSIIGIFKVDQGGEREVLVSKESDVVDQGDAPVKPMPVIVDPKALVNGGDASVFQDASGALVQFQNVVVSDINSYQDFDVSTDGMTNKATIASSFLSRVMQGYKAPAAGTKLKSVTGIVFTDYKGSVWARTPADVVPM
jgi:hypothetical protein